MPVSAASSLALFLANARTLIANSPAFQAWTRHPGDAAAAANSVYLVGAPLPRELGGDSNAAGYTLEHFQQLRPFVVINFHVRDGFSLDKVADATFLDSAKILFSFEDSVPAEDELNYQEAVTAFLNNVGSVVQEIASLAGTASYANLMNLKMEKMPQRGDLTERATRGDYHFVLFSADMNAA